MSPGFTFIDFLRRLTLNIQCFELLFSYTDGLNNSFCDLKMIDAMEITFIFKQFCSNQIIYISLNLYIKLLR